MDFGAFVQLSANQDGMVHVSEMAPYRVGRTSDLVTIGDTVQVKIKEIQRKVFQKTIESNRMLRIPE